MILASVVVACHNEAGSVAAVIAGIKQYVPSAEIIVVDDGSTDDTPRVLAELSGIRVIHHDKNQGKGATLRRGMVEAHGERLIFIDADGQDDPADLPRLLAVADAGERFVNGSKFIGAIEQGGISTPNYWGNRFMSGAIHLLFGGAVTDSQSGFRILDRTLAASWNLTSTEYEIETEMLCKALKAGVRVAEVPVTRKARTGGRTGFRRVRNGLRILRTIFRERFLTR